MSTVANILLKPVLMKIRLLNVLALSAIAEVVLQGLSPQKTSLLTMSSFL